jgi:hypothetical protein
MAQRKYWRVSFLIENAHYFDLNEFLAARGAREFEGVIVRHGGEDDSGQLLARPTTREFIMAYIAAQRGKQFAVLDLKNEARSRGLHAGTVGQAAVTLADEGLLKRIDIGIYQERTRKNGANGHKLIVGQSADLVMKLINAAGVEGIHVEKIREAFKAEKLSPKSVNGCVGKMVNAKMIKNAGRGVYTAV